MGRMDTLLDRRPFFAMFEYTPEYSGIEDSVTLTIAAVIHIPYKKVCQLCQLYVNIVVNLLWIL